MDSPQYLVALIQTIIFLTPVIILIWKMSGYAHQINQNKINIDNLGKKLDEVVKKQQTEQSEMVAKISIVSSNVTEILAIFKYLKEDIDYIKKDIKEMGKVK